MSDDRTLDARFWALVKGNSKRTWICSPGEADLVRAWVEREGTAEVVTVVASQFVPPGEIVVSDLQAIRVGFEESTNAAMRHWTRGGRDG